MYDEKGTWEEYRIKVTTDIKELKQSVKDLQERLSSLREDMVEIKTKVAIWGAISVIIASAVSAGIAKGVFG